MLIYLSQLLKFSQYMHVSKGKKHVLFKQCFRREIIRL